MMLVFRKSLGCLFLSAGVLFGAAGDVVSVVIATDGWHAEVTLESLEPGGTYSTRLGLGAGNDPESGDPDLVLTVTSDSFDASGNATTIQRYVYGTIAQAQAYPNQATADETDLGANVTLSIVLSDWIFNDDTVAYSAGAGLYTNGTASNAASGSATNNSTVDYQVADVFWTWPGNERVTGAFKLRAKAFHHSGGSFFVNGEQQFVRFLRFEVTDGTNTETVDVASPTIDGTMGDANPVGEWVADFDAADFIDDIALTCNVTAYPMIGDTTTTSTGGASQPSPLLGPLTLYCDNDDDAGVYAKVDPTSPSGTPQTYTVGTYDFGTAEAYASISAAANAGANVIELVEDNYNWLGDTGTYSTFGFWTIVRAGTGEARANVVINADTGDDDISDLIKVEGVKITSAGSPFNGIDELWFHDCEFDTASASLVSHATTPGVWHVTQSTLTQLAQGLRPFGTGQNNPPGVVRGNTISGFDGVIQIYVCVGNLRNSTYQAAQLFDDIFTGDATPHGPRLLADNAIFGWSPDGATPMIEVADDGENASGMCIVNNVFENVDSNQLVNMGSADSDDTRWIVWNNTFLGGRAQTAYNDAHIAQKYYWSMVNNYWDVRGLKSDVFGTNGTYIENWQVMYQVGCSGNVDAGIAAIAAQGFDSYYEGLNSVEPVDEAHTYAEFVAAARYNGSAGAGLGDYHVALTSPLRWRTKKLGWPFDVAGKRRFPGDVAGAYTWLNSLGQVPSGTKRKVLIR